MDLLWVTEGVETHGLHSGDGKPTVQGQCNRREVLRERKVQPTTGPKAINFLMEDMQWQGHSREGTAQKPSEEMLKEKFKNKKGEGSTARRKKAAQGNDCSYSSWKYGSLKQEGDCNKRGRIWWRGEKKEEINWSTFPQLCFNFLDLSIRKTRTSHTWIFWKKLKTVGWTYVTGSNNLTQVSCSLTNCKIPLLKKSMFKKPLFFSAGVTIEQQDGRIVTQVTSSVTYPEWIMLKTWVTEYTMLFQFI